MVKTETAAFYKALTKLESRICNAILGGVRLLEFRKHKNITQEKDEYCGLPLDEEITVLRFDCIQASRQGDTIEGVVLKGTAVALIKGDECTDDIDIYYTGDLDVDLCDLVKALDVVETLVRETKQ